MIILQRFNQYRHQHSLQITRKEDSDLWRVEIGIWEDGKKLLLPDHLPEDSGILMDQNDLKNLASELEKVLERKPLQNVELNLTTRKNTPHFRSKVHFCQSSNEMIHIWHDTFAVGLGFNVKFAELKHTGKDYRYLYEGEGSYLFSYDHVTPKQLKKFITELEKASKSGNFENPWWQFWK